MGRQRVELELDIVDLSHDGRGVARHDGKAVFVDGALPGERVRAERIRHSRRHDEATTREVLRASPERVEPRCAHFGTCAGCTLQHLDPAGQIRAKERNLIENLARIGHVAPETVLPPLQAEPWGYRRRGRLSVRHVEKKGRTLVGFRELDARFVAELATCPVAHPVIGTRIAMLAALVDSLDARREIPQIEFAVGDEVACLVFRTLVELAGDDRARLAEFARREGLAVLLQPGGTDSVTPLEPAVVDLSFSLPRHGVRLAFEPLDFIQVNAAINEAMIDHAIDLLAPRATDRVLDLFCGLGNFTLPVARRVAAVAGVEGEATLIARARANAERNGLGNVAFHQANLFEDQKQASWAREHWDLVLLDPPRAGAEAAVEWLPQRGVRRLVYVSCHPASLARDAGALVHRHGYRLRSASVMDMFPHTGHVESIAMFER
jgi:23S rRNA (uracil1939-C5)-methyltransferase